MADETKKRDDETTTPYIMRLARSVRAKELTLETALHAALSRPQNWPYNEEGFDRLRAEIERLRDERRIAARLLKNAVILLRQRSDCPWPVEYHRAIDEIDAYLGREGVS